ncbi:hypothetical protein SAMN05192558_105254 [Actinokineospora alba]|uniref:Uncharacterized protein n=1 Tax=Actinokineospora alba TaxID=504798 RepID=A0A1H0N914_9PSEU|nr:hypothetical protein [Actinokineospora alba]TDP68625.1 hypothetical protein C8E96_4190 [Actinokineospora alba]SDH83093.1 hypothetical protein SAMN05421871_102304 [Actinokineospora alba]SDO89148.1 hypothetical protein SAMN05192558_105254 [Actinokineospora alba]
MVPSARELAHDLVETLAPEELPSFALVAEPYLTDPRRAEKQLRDHDDPMGFGLGDALAMATPVIALVSGSVVTALSDSVAASVRDAGGKLVRKLTRKKELPPAQEWTPEQLDEIREVALARALDLGMKKAKAETLADALVGALLRRRDK